MAHSDRLLQPFALPVYLEQLLSEESKSAGNRIEVYHYDALVKTLLGDVSVARLDSEADDAWHSRIGIMLRDDVRDRLVLDRNDAILIDECQDFAVEWLESLTGLLNSKTDSLAVVSRPDAEHL